MAMDQRSLPVYTILLPLYKEKPSTIRALFEALSAIDYPKHKLDGLLLIEDDDAQTRGAIEEVGRPAWIRPMPLPPGVPRTKPRAMCIGLRYARGSLVTVYDAEDRPDRAQLKKAVWGFQRIDDSVACLQAKLGYYNPRQNLLTRWFTLEYDAWFNIFLPGLHRIGAPIPLGGTSNHFRRSALDACLGWDPYNVTEDADLGLRFARLGLRTAMLESTTDEEANSRVPGWVRQRSRWSKGYMQTMLVHTRRPSALLRELGPKGTAVSLLTVGGGVVTALLAPIFWLMLALWIFDQPEWIATLFPGPIFYVASLSLVLGNFLLILLSLGAAVRRGHDDLAPHALLIPCYWVLMSAATYLALVELVFRPHHWHKTEHGLHFAEEPT
jgi:cellulose synthase/poly-beta-1,6-N-acetylglucosamine synthase-like glycosyltransferase